MTIFWPLHEGDRTRIVRTALYFLRIYFIGLANRSSMSILLITGTTGFVGQHVLEAALASPSFSKVFSVTRRPIPSDSPHKGNIKLEEIILEDEAQWLQWPPSVLQRIGHIDACIW